MLWVRGRGWRALPLCIAPVHVTLLLYPLQLATKDACAQNILAHEALYKVSPLLDQFKQGLKKVDMLRLVQAFPDLYIALFTFSGDVSAEDMAEALYVDEAETEPEQGDQLVLQFLHRYVRECSDTVTMLGYLNSISYVLQVEL